MLPLLGAWRSETPGGQGAGARGFRPHRISGDGAELLELIETERATLLAETERSTLDALIGGRQAWSDEADLLASGHALETLERLEGLGLVAPWTLPGVRAFTLTPYG